MSLPELVSSITNSLDRRTFLKTGVMSLLPGLAACKSNLILNSNTKNRHSTEKSTAKSHTTRSALTEVVSTPFNPYQKAILSSVQMHLFPDDGNGPSAKGINATSYLEWAMTDKQNIHDGDAEFIIQGTIWLEALSEQTQGAPYLNLSENTQQQLLHHIANSQTGENWLSILMYYITEALMLDPVYGGNPDNIGWNWLEHQPGFPAPEAGQTYRDFQ